jgi:membrane-associated phospholipid phosphatase
MTRLRATDPPRRRSSRPLFLGLVALLTALGAARADDGGPGAASAPDRPYWRTNVFARVLTDQKYLVTSWWPHEFRRPAFTAPILAATIAAFRSTSGGENDGIDFSVLHAMEPATATTTDRVATGFTQLGEGALVAAGLGITYLGARHAGSDGLAATSSLATESLIDAGIYVTVLKAAFARVRPGQQGQGQFFQYGKPNATSFPSGHAFGAFSVASVFAESYHDVHWVPWVAYGGASLIAASRAVLGRHFPTDLLVGGILGDSMGHAVIARAESKGDGSRGWWRHVVPVVNPGPGGGLGIGLDLSR